MEPPDAQAVLESRLFAIAEHIDQLMAVTLKNREDIAMILRALNSMDQGAPPAAAPSADVQAALHHFAQRLEAMEQAQQPLLARSEKMEQWLAHLVQNSSRPAETAPAAPPYSAPPMRAVPSMSAAPSLTDPATAERLALALEQLRRVTDGSSGN